jgi:hypothetical protein
MITSILIIQFILNIVLACVLFKSQERLEKLEENQLTAEDLSTGEVVIKHKGKIIYNSK